MSDNVQPAERWSYGRAAALHGVSKHRVREIRDKLGIPPTRKAA